MAIARDTNGVVAGSTNTGKTLSLTLAANTILVAGCYSEADTITMTWNGVAMTQIVQLHDATLGYYITLFFLGNPASGTHDLVSSMPSTYNDLYGVSYTGASTTDPTSFDAQFSGSATSISVTLSNANNAWYFGVGNGQALSGTTNATLLDTSNPTFQADFDSNGIASSNTMTISRSGTARIGLAAFAIPEAGAAAATQVSRGLSLLGVGQ